MMGKSQQKLTKKPKTSRKTGRKLCGTTRNKQKSPASPVTPAAPANQSGVPSDGSMSLGWKSGAPGDRSKSRKHKVEPEPGEGAERLRGAVDILVSRQCGRIAKALVDKTIAGNMTGARLVAELSGAKDLRNKPVKKRHEPILPWSAAELAAEPQWKGPPEDDEETGDPAFESSAATTSL
jgi:hypothetical protein